MISIAAADETKDSNLKFDPSIGEDERRFYMKAYPTVDCVKDRKVHCTICKMHIGTAPSNESLIKMHPILRVTHCTKCHDFYNSGEFSKGEDGSELYCRWCGQGGEVYCCSNCPFVFCKSCIIKNLSRGVVADIEQNENWSCFNCAPKILWPLRAQHWALINYIEKQKKVILSSNLLDRDIKIQMSKDRSTCCRLVKPKSDNEDSAENNDGSLKCYGLPERRLRKLSTSKQSESDSPATKKTKTNDQVVCTPDLLSMLIPDCELTVAPKTKLTSVPTASSPKIMSIQQPPSGFNVSSVSQSSNGSFSVSSIGGDAGKTASPPPLVIRNSNVTIRPTAPTPVVRRTIVGPRTPVPSSGTTPVYHTINGFRIDLNSAAQQETFRLPNGKLIQVKRQGTNTTQPQQQQQQFLQSQSQSPSSVGSPTGNSWARSGSPMQGRGLQVNHALPPGGTMQQQYHISPQLHHQIHVPTIGSTTVRYVSQAQMAQQNIHHNGPMHFQINGANSTNSSTMSSSNSAPAAAVPQGSTATIRPVMIRHIFPDTPIGNARTQLQNQIFNAMEICQHLIGKFQTLTNSNAYKFARNQIDIKELYIHLSYLLTYANGRFKGLQDKCLDDMRQLGFIHDADNLENGQLAADKQASDDEDNEIEIVEPKTDTITLDSDNDEDETTTTTTTTATAAATTSKDEQNDKTPISVEIPSLSSSPTVTTVVVDQFSVTSSTSAQSIQTSSAQSALPVSASVATATVATPLSGTVAENLSPESCSFDVMANILAGMLEVELTEPDQQQSAKSASTATVTPNTSSTGCDSKLKKQPRKKTTNKPNPTLIKQKEILERERLEEMKRNDTKLKMKCVISLPKAEDVFPQAKMLMEMPGTTSNAAAEETTHDENDEVEVLLVDELDDYIEDVAHKLSETDATQDEIKKSDHEDCVLHENKVDSDSASSSTNPAVGNSTESICDIEIIYDESTNHPLKISSVSRTASLDGGGDNEQLQSTVAFKKRNSFHNDNDNDNDNEISCQTPISPSLGSELALINGEPEVDVDQEIDKLLRLRESDCNDGIADDLNACIENCKNITNDSTRKTLAISSPELSDEITELVLG